MEAKDNEDVTQATSADRAEQVADADSREDNRNEEVSDSPVPDPESEDTDAGDDPGAD